jgi:hypothetical protein
MNRKSFHIPLLCLLLALACGGCTKFLTHDDPSGVTDNQWWNTEDDATNALNTIYAGLPSGANGGNPPNQIMYWSGLSDEAITRGDESGKGEFDTYTRGLQDSRWDVGQALWKSSYVDIRRANRFLEHVDHCYMTEALKSRMKFEARALRAFYHMQLLLFFGDVPLVTHALTPEENQMPRDSAAAVYRFVVSELQVCADSLPETYVNADNWRITSGACSALISRLALYFHHYALARDAAKRVIDSKVYSLYHSTDGVNSYLELFTYAGELNDERILFSRNGCSTAWTTLAPVGVGGKTFISPTASEVNNYETLQGKTLQELGPDSVKIYEKDPDYKGNRDPRLAASVYYPGEDFQGIYTLDPFNNPTDKIGATRSTATGYWVRKYIDPKDQQTKSGSLDFMIIRYAEVLLNYTESLVELGDWQNPDVVKYLNEIRNRAGMPDVDVTEYDSQEKMRQLVRRERQAELAFEGQRYFDIRRWGIADQVMNGTVYGATNPATGLPVTVEDRKYDPDRDALWPIPQSELLANPNMKQNPGYAN